MKEFEKAVEEWGREQGASKMGFFTRRNHRAFCRMLKDGWKFDSHFLLRELA